MHYFFSIINRPFNIIFIHQFCFLRKFDIVLSLVYLTIVKHGGHTSLDMWYEGQHYIYQVQIISTTTIIN